MTYHRFPRALLLDEPVTFFVYRKTTVSAPISLPPQSPNVISAIKALGTLKKYLPLSQMNQSCSRFPKRPRLDLYRVVQK